MNVKGLLFPYLPPLKDFCERMNDFGEEYEMYDEHKIRKCLLAHCTIRNQKLFHYIMRKKPDAKSDLAADVENFVENQVIPKINETKDYATEG